MAPLKGLYPRQPVRLDPQSEKLGLGASRQALYSATHFAAHCPADEGAVSLGYGSVIVLVTSEVTVVRL